MNKSQLINQDSGEKTWLTPLNIIHALGEFDLDPCCPQTMPWRTATEMVCRPADGLAVDWTGKRVWCNPPYGREAVPFVKRMISHIEEGGGGILLIFARTDTALWQDLIFPFAERILYIRGRLTFCREDGTTETTATAPSALIAFANEDADVLDNCEIEGARQ